MCWKSSNDHYKHVFIDNKLPKLCARDFSCLEDFSTEVEASICSSVSAWPQRPWACAPIRAKVWLDPKWICTWRLCQTSIHLLLPPPAAHPNPQDRQTGGRRVQRQNGSAGGGWAILIQCLLYLEREGANGAFLTRLTLDQSHHTFSQGTWAFFFLPSPPFLFLPLSALHLFSLSFLFC